MPSLRLPILWPSYGIVCALMAANLITCSSAVASDGQNSSGCIPAALQSELLKVAASDSTVHRVRFETSRQDPKQLERASDLLQTIQSRYSKYFPLPKKMDVVIKDQSAPFFAVFPVAKMIHDALAQDYSQYIHYQARVVAVRNSLREINEAEIAHEIGHAMFLERVENADPAWREALDQMKTFYKSLHDLFPNPAGPYSSSNFSKIKPLLTQEVAQAKGRLGYSAPYEELFADIVAVDILDNPNAVSDVFINETSASLDLMAARARSFSTRQSKKELQELGRLTSSGDNPEPHVALKPTRFFLWNQYLSKTKDTNKRAEILDRVYSAIVADFNENYRNGNPVKRTAEEMNASLIRRIRAMQIDL